MQYSDLDQFLVQAKQALSKGPVAMIFVEDEIEINSTVRHHLIIGFKEVLVFMPPSFDIANDIEEQVHRINYDLSNGGSVTDTVNRVMNSAPNIWMYYCYNAEYLFFPFCETRNIGEMLTFQTEERRDTTLTYVIDLYAGDLDHFPNAVSLENAFIDKSGYYALERKDPENNYDPRERQLDFYGGLRWRFEEHIPYTKRKIDRISLFRSRPKLKLRADHTFNDEEYNTYACPWHNNMTASIASFRVAKALKYNPGSKLQIQTFKWHNSTMFEWHSRQLLDLGLMETGQWF